MTTQPTEDPSAAAPPPAPSPPAPRWPRLAAWSGRLSAWSGRLSVWSGRLAVAGVFLLRLLVGAAALGAIGLYLFLAVRHLRHPFEIEWMEGGLVEEVRRAASGQALYVKPTLEYVPFIYAPLWFYFAAAFAKVLGVGYFSARLSSFVASIGAIALVYRIVAREGRSHLAGLLAAGLFAGTYPLASGFFDVARVDSLFVLILLAGIYTLRARSSVASRFAAAALFTLAFLTKQSGVVVFAPIALHVLVAERYRRGLAFAAGGAAMMIAVTALLIFASDGWFYYFAFWIPRQHPWVPRMWIDFWREDLLRPLAVSVVVSLFYCVVDRGVEGRRFWLAAAAGMLGASWLGRLHAGGWPNVIMPGLAVLATLFGLGVAAALRIAEDQPARRRSVEAFVLVLAAIQFAMVAYDPGPLLPSDEDVASGEKLIDMIRAVKGEVFVPAHNHFAALAGKRAYAHEMAISDIVGIGGGEPGKDLRAELERALAEKRFDAVFADTGFFRREIERSYRVKRAPFTDKDGLWPVTGMRTRPNAMYVPK